MLKINRVDTLDNQTLDIELSNGNLILFNLKDLLESDPEYASLRSEILLPRPKTDGQSVFWMEGPRLTLNEILKLLSMSMYDTNQHQEQHQEQYQEQHQEQHDKSGR